MRTHTQITLLPATSCQTEPPTHAAARLCADFAMRFKCWRSVREAAHTHIMLQPATSCQTECYPTTHVLPGAVCSNKSCCLPLRLSC